MLFGSLVVTIAAFVVAALALLLLCAIATELGKVRYELEILRAEMHDADSPQTEPRVF